MQNPPQAHPTWQQVLSEGFSHIEQLCHYLELKSELLPDILTHTNFPFRVPLGFAACMEKGNPHDPLLRQVLPLSAEHIDYPGYSSDPVGDLAAHPSPGIIHKYQGRALMIVTGSCAINCRYCFRRNFPYADVQVTKTRLHSSIEYLQQHSELSEVILSGGDPLLLKDDRWEDLMLQLATIKHIQRIRIHSRIPVVLPERISAAFLQVLGALPQKIVLVLHANHANELSPKVAQACYQLAQFGVTLLNQSVLLKGVNDNAEALIHLSEKLFQIGVLPYYLHLLDKAKGTGHFEVPLPTALALHQTLLHSLPGYLVPKLVAEQAGAASKMPLYA